MNVKTIIICAVLIATPCVTQGTESLNQKSIFGKSLAWISQSKAMHWLEQNIQTKIDQSNRKFLGFGNEPASEHYQDLGKEAQTKVGIPEAYHVPIKCLNPNGIMAQRTAAVETLALAKSHAIFVHEKIVDQVPYGAQRSALFHEAIHRKYKDGATYSSLKNLVFIAALFGSHKLIQMTHPQGHFILHELGALLTGMSSAIAASHYYHTMMERRADIEGYYATQCWQCVKESTVSCRPKFFQLEEINLFKNKGYLLADELDQIAKDLQQENKLCTYHQQKL